MDFDQVEIYLRNFCLRKDTEIHCVFRTLNTLKQEFVKNNDQLKAKRVWIYERILNIQSLIVLSYDKLKYAYAYGKWIEKTIKLGIKYLREKLFHKSFQILGSNLEFNKKRRDLLYEKSWTLLIDSEHHLDILSYHLDYNNDSCDKYSLKLIKNQIEKIQVLFPFKLFISMGGQVSHKICNICGRKVTSPRNDCEHESFEIYNGMMCIKIPYLEKILHHAITPYPRDKACIIFAPEGRHYSYKYLEYLISIHPSIFVKINYNWINEIQKDWDTFFKTIENRRNKGERPPIRQIIESLLE